MGSLETIQVSSRSVEPISGPRISFSADFLDEKNFISISPNPHAEKGQEKEKDKEKTSKAEFEFLSSSLSNPGTMITADELFFEGKLLPFWQMQHAEKLNKISLKSEQADEGKNEVELTKKEEPRISWFLDDDPSPRPPKCTVLWKELLRLKKQRASSLSLSPSSSTSSTSSSSSSRSLTDMPPIDEGKERAGNREKHVKRIKKGLERTRSASMRVRPVINVPICTQGKNSALPPMFSIKKGRIER